LRGIGEAAAWRSPAEVFDGLAGAWRLERRISPAIRMDGEAQFATSADGTLAYEEQGTLTLADGTALPANRRYLFRRRPGGFAVFFAEETPRLFHEVALHDADAVLLGETEHLCTPDHYRSRYEFHPDGSFTIRHEVAGPRKDYVSLTHYARPAA